MKYFQFFIIVISSILLQACKTENANVIITEETPWGTEQFRLPVFNEKQFPITGYGAKTGSAINNQTAIQAAIDDCNSKKGGSVIIPEGTWKTSFITLKSNVNLHLEKGAVLLFIDDFELYKVPTFTRWEGIECMNYHPLIYAKDAENIAITGEGKIDGNGKKWWKLREHQIESLSKLYDKVQANVAPENRNCLNFKPTSYLRPSLIQTVNCKNVLVKGVEINSGPMWTVHFVYSENVVARNLKIVTSGSNNDGITPDACKKVLIDNCSFSTGDDCIVIKSGLNEDGWRVGKASQRIIIKNCHTKTGHGGVVIGSEMSGGVKNIYAHDCDFSGTLIGVRVKSMKGRGGIVENLWFKNIRMDSIKQEAIRINMHYGASSIAPRTTKLPVFRNFHFENINTSFSKNCIQIKGIHEQKIENLTFKNIKMKGESGVTMENANNCSFESVTIESVLTEPLKITFSENINFSQSVLKSQFGTMVVIKDNCKSINLGGTNINGLKNGVVVTNSEQSEITFK